MFVSSALVILACGESDSAPPAPATPADGGSSSGSSSGSSGSVISTDSGGACTGLEQAGAPVDILGTKAPIPEAKGGAPVDGNFVLTSVKAFAAILQEGAVVRAFGAYTLSIHNNGTEFEQVVTNPENQVTRAKGNLVADGVSFTATPACEDPLNADGGVTILSGKYTVDGSNLKMYVIRDFGITAELLFEKR
jgi:hypothetical protein